MKLRGALLLALAAAAAPALGQVPVAVVERIVTQGEVATRVSLFSNRVVTVSIRQGGQQSFLRRITLPENDYMVYLSTFESNAAELDEKPISSDVATSRAEAVVLLHVGPDAPREIRFSPMSGVKLPLARILGALDDLQLQVLEASPSAEAMRVWEPRKGDRVQLLNGSYATVINVWTDGILILEHDDTFVRETILPDLRDQVILRVLDPEQ